MHVRLGPRPVSWIFKRYMVGLKGKTYSRYLKCTVLVWSYEVLRIYAKSLTFVKENGEGGEMKESRLELVVV